MLPEEIRLNDKKIIDRISKRGKVFKTRLGMVRYIEAVKPQFTFAVSKKSCKLAVDRNRLKRRMRALIFKNLESLPRVSAIFFVSNTVNKYSWQALNEEWQKCLKSWPRN